MGCPASRFEIPLPLSIAKDLLTSYHDNFLLAAIIQQYLLCKPFCNNNKQQQQQQSDTAPATMKFTNPLFSLLLAAKLSTALPAPQATVTLLFYKTSATHKKANHANAEQAVLNTPSSTLHIAVGQVLSFDQAPLHVHTVEIANVQAGTDLSNPPQWVEQSSKRVV